MAMLSFLLLQLVCVTSAFSHPNAPRGDWIYGSDTHYSSSYDRQQQRQGTQTVTIHNDRARLAVDGTYVDAHDGMILHHGGVYYLYGESYGNQTLAEPYPWQSVPRLLVYTSSDLVNWTCRGDPLPMVKGTLWIPNVIYDSKTTQFIMWYGSGGWASATSKDGINFTPSKYGRFSSRFGDKAGTDGTGLFVDDDGQGYVVFASKPPGIDMPGTSCPPEIVDCHHYGHIVSIEKITDDYLTTTKVRSLH